MSSGTLIRLNMAKPTNEVYKMDGSSEIRAFPLLFFDWKSEDFDEWDWSQFQFVRQVLLKKNSNLMQEMEFISFDSDGSDKRDQQLHLRLKENEVKIFKVKGFPSPISSVYRLPIKGDEQKPKELRDFNFEIIPNEIIFHVFSYLNYGNLRNVAQVCKRWKEISKAVQRKLPVLDLRRYIIDDLSINYIASALDGCSNMKCLKVKQSFIQDMTLSLLIAKKCSHLEALEWGSPLSNVGLCIIKSSCRELKSLSLNGLRFSEYNLQKILILYKDINRLELIGDVFGGLVSDLILRILRPVSNFTLSEMSDFPAPAKYFSNLTSLTLKTLPFLNDKYMKDTFKACPNIEYLEVSDMSQTDVTFHGLYFIGSLKNLTSLALTKMPIFGMDLVLIEITNHCLQLNYLDISDCEYVTDRGIQALQALINLKTLSMNNLKKITSKSVQAIALCKNLTTFSMAGCSNVCCYGPLAIVTKCPFLESLNVSFNKKIDDEFIIYCWQHFQTANNAKTFSINVQGCSVYSSSLISQCPFPYQFTAHELKYKIKGSSKNKIKWLWGSAVATSNDSSGQVYEFHCQTY